MGPGMFLGPGEGAGYRALYVGRPTPPGQCKCTGAGLTGGVQSFHWPVRSLPAFPACRAGTTQRAGPVRTACRT
ncbi:hypothetical protein SXCC_02499 [Gluconacetobacter sp. SXCC-1]|uniref:hypothetical protein n=1 Tax=Komagataeibacter rhaeticus TaxID=215221 RepID=UPI0002080511|nr:hypothetical protein [Komagataeibacter rhaeticus]ATU72949.1 hypothetical protein CT154_08960 [Komagataeibacter xylinus]EGG77287.1 hypothetical protein SXCC_02499 [Gluconacetobacter sp. SXCC-1]